MMKALLRKILKDAVNYVGPDTSLVDKNVLTLLDKTRLVSLTTMLGVLDSRQINGDVVIAGVWRGGSAAWMGAILKEMQIDRRIWCCDTYAGFPEGSAPHKTGGLAVPLEEVKHNIEQIVGDLQGFIFLEGDFKDTLPGNIDDIALLHFDGDSPRATTTVLNRLYDSVVPGGFVVIDDYCLRDCRKALLAWLRTRFLDTVRPKLMNPYTGKALKQGEAPCGVWWRK